MKPRLIAELAEPERVAYLGDEYFDPEGLALAQRAMVTLNIHCFSTREGAVAKAILDAFMVRQPICRRRARREAWRRETARNTSRIT